MAGSQAAGDIQQKLKQMARLARERQADIEDAAAGTAGGSATLDDWNKLESLVDDTLIQTGEITPPEKYKKAMKRYFDVISKDR
jgi:hypothetical protein